MTHQGLKTERQLTLNYKKWLISPIVVLLKVNTRKHLFPAKPVTLTSLLTKSENKEEGEFKMEPF